MKKICFSFCLLTWNFFTSQVWNFGFIQIYIWFVQSLSHRRKMSTKSGVYDISYHNSWYTCTCRCRKIKEDSSTEREKSPLQFEPIFITVQCTSRLQDFFLMKNDQEIFKLATLLMIENPLFLMQIGNVFLFFVFFVFCNALHLFWKCH